MKLHASWETDVTLYEDGRVYIEQHDDPNDSVLVILAPHQIRPVIEELERIAKELSL